MQAIWILAIILLLFGSWHLSVQSLDHLAPGRSRFKVWVLGMLASSENFTELGWRCQIQARALALLTLVVLIAYRLAG